MLEDSSSAYMGLTTKWLRYNPKRGAASVPMSHETRDRVRDTAINGIARCMPEQSFKLYFGFGLRAVDLRYNHRTKPEPISFNRTT